MDINDRRRNERDQNRGYDRDKQRMREEKHRSRSRSNERDRDRYKEKQQYQHNKDNRPRGRGGGGGGGGGGDNEKYEYGKKEIKKEEDLPVKEKEKPSLEPSGNLAKDTNTYNGIVIKYNEPPEARKPIRRWRLYCFKADQEFPFYPIHRQSAYLFGRERLIADIPVEHPSCSKQHAVFQYRLVDYKRKNGTNGRAIRPYIIDLGSTNGTFINNKQIEAQRYYELREKDVLKFGFSTREYVLLHEESKNDLPSDDEIESEKSDQDSEKDKELKNGKKSPKSKSADQIADDQVRDKIKKEKIDHRDESSSDSDSD